MGTFRFVAFFCSFLFVINSVNGNIQTLYVSKRGALINNVCGNWSNPCPTLFDVSYQIKYISRMDRTKHFIVHVTDGQNETRIAEIMNLLQHPCLFDTANTSPEQITIAFNETTIRDLNDWFPRSLCAHHSINPTQFDYQ
eukprot:1169222_1